MSFFLLVFLAGADVSAVKKLPLGDGGMPFTTPKPTQTCVRRRKGSKPQSCMRLHPGEETPRDFGEENNFPTEQSVGEDCEPVKCFVTF